MDTEDAIHLHLDAHPDDHTARLALADWLDEAGDPRGSGYRALGLLGKYPCRDPYWPLDRDGAYVRRPGPGPGPPPRRSDSNTGTIP